MSNKKFFLLILAMIAVIFGYALTRQASPPPAKAEFSSLDSMVGKPAPDFTLKDQKGKDFKLSSLRGKTVVLFFNEGIMCYPACWNQIAALGTDEKLNNGSVVSASIVTDSFSAWDSAFKKMPELDRGVILFDSFADVSKTYGMLSLESSMHKGAKPGHTYVIIDQKGVIRYTKDDPSMGIRNTEIDQKVAEV